MAASGGEALYTSELLALAVSLADFPLEESLTTRGEARSRSCGSTLVFATRPDEQGKIGSVGLRVSACAVGQAAAAIFAAHARGQSPEDVGLALREIEQWLEDGGELPAWPDIPKLAAARSYPGRHGAIMLPWRAALAALCKADAER